MERNPPRLHNPLRPLAMLALSLASLLAGCLSDSRNPSNPPAAPAWLPDSVSVSTWSGGAKAAYSVILDDFCGGWARGIQDEADTMFHSRGLVFSFAIIPSECNTQDWDEARRLVSHGHFPANHSMDQFCAVMDSWCPGPWWGPEDYAMEIDSSEAWIERETGIRPAFMVFPYDLWTPELLTALRQRHYLGARTAVVRGKVNPPDIQDAFDISWDLEFPEANKNWQSYTLRSYVQAAVEQGGWAFQAAHGVEDESYGSLNRDTLRLLLDEVKSLVDSGVLWNAVPTQVISYSLLRQSLEPALTQDPDSATVRWVPRASGPLKEWAEWARYDTDLTVNLWFRKVPEGLKVRRGGKEVEWTKVDSTTVRVQTRPGAGPLTLSL